MTAQDLRRNARRIATQGWSAPALLPWLPWRDLAASWSSLDQTTMWEQAWTVRHLRRADLSGEVVELGALFGAITAAIGRGVRGRSVRVTVYDAFDWRYITPVPGTRAAGLEASGVRPRQVFDDRVRSWAPSRLVVHEGDVLDQSWSGRPIAFLQIDVAKTWEIWNHVKATWVAAVSVGGVVVQQDWAHAMTPWLHVWHHRWRSSFEVVDHVPHSGSVVFRLRSPLPPEALGPDAPADFDRSEIGDAFQWSVQLVDRSMRAEIRAARENLEASAG